MLVKIQLIINTAAAAAAAAAAVGTAHLGTPYISSYYNTIVVNRLDIIEYTS